MVSKALIGELGTPKVETSALVVYRATFSKSNVCNCVTPKWVWDLRVKGVTGPGGLPGSGYPIEMPTLHLVSGFQ